MHALDEQEYYTLLQQNHTKFLIQYLRKRFWQVVKSRKFEIVVVRRELLLFNDYGNLFLEKLLLKIHPNAILDFDDDLSAAKSQPKAITNRYAKILGEHGDKFNETLKKYNKFIVASGYLKDRVTDQNKRVDAESICVIPTCVDYDRYPPKEYPESFQKLTFGWIGGDHNYPLVDKLIPVLNALAEKYDFQLLVIGRSPYKRDTSFAIQFIPWSLETEVEFIKQMDIGLMPLEDNAMARGKGGFKLIQYMGLGVVGVAQAITINREIIDHRKNSFLIENDPEWLPTLEAILEGRHNLAEIGANARKKITESYSVKAYSAKYINFIRYVLEESNN